MDWTRCRQGGRVVREFVVRIRKSVVDVIWYTILVLYAREKYGHERVVKKACV